MKWSKKAISNHKIITILCDDQKIHNFIKKILLNLIKYEIIILIEKYLFILGATPWRIILIFQFFYLVEIMPRKKNKHSINYNQYIQLMIWKLKNHKISYFKLVWNFII